MVRIGIAIKLVGVPYKHLTVPLLEYSYGVCQEYEVEANVCAGVLKPGVNFVYISKKLPGNHQSLPALINKKIHEAEYLFSTQDSSCVNLMFRIACQYYFPPCGNSIQQEAPVPLCKEECQLVQSVCPDTWKTTALAFSHSIPFISCNDTSELLFPPRNCCTAAGIELPQSSSESLTLCQISPSLNSANLSRIRV